jgi:hypothetical protein
MSPAWPDWGSRDWILPAERAETANQVDLGDRADWIVRAVRLSPVQVDPVAQDRG